MNKVTALFATTTVMLGAATIYLAHALRAERARSPVVPERQVDASVVLPPPAIQLVAPDDTSPTPAKSPNAVATPASPVKIPARVKSRTYSAAQLAYLKLQVQDEYPDIAAALGLQPAEAEAFVELLARQRLQDQEDARAQFGRKPVDSGQWQKEQEQRRRANIAEQAELLGEGRTAEWDRYRNTAGSRAEARELRMQLADSDYPLRRDQYDSLAAALADEEIRHKREREQLRNSSPNRGTTDHAQVIEFFDKRFTLIEQSLARRERAASVVLDSEQLRRYREMLEHERRVAQAEYESFVTVNAEAARNGN